MRNSPMADRKSATLDALPGDGRARKRSFALRRKAALAGMDLNAVAFIGAAVSQRLPLFEGSTFDALNGNKLLFQKYLLISVDPPTRKRPSRLRLFSAR